MIWALKIIVKPENAGWDGWFAEIEDHAVEADLSGESPQMIIGCNFTRSGNAELYSFKLDENTFNITEEDDGDDDVGFD